MKLDPRDLIPLVYFLGAALGEAVEVALVDMMEERYIVVCHGMNGRQADDPYVLPPRLKKALAQGRDWIESSDRSGAAYFLRDQEGGLRGLLILRRNYGSLLDVYANLGEVLVSLGLTPPAAGKGLEDLVDQELDRLLPDRDIPSLPVREKKLTVAALEEAGVFQVKGAVNCVANRLGVSAPTVYRYLKKMS